MTDLLPVTLAEMLAELERELKARARVYPRQIAKRRLTQEVADRRVQVLQALLLRLRRGPQEEASPAGEAAGGGPAARVEAALARGGVQVAQIGARFDPVTIHVAGIPAEGTDEARAEAALADLRRCYAAEIRRGRRRA